MKTILSLCLALAVAASARAEIYRSGGVHRGDDHYSGGHSGSHTTVRIGIGPGYGYGYGYGYGPRYYGYSPYRYVPVASYYDGYGYGYPYYDSGYYAAPATSGAANGLVLGALAGGIIGNNSGSLHNSGLRGAAWGAGLGWLLGTVADANRASASTRAPVVVQQAAPAPVQFQSAPVPSQPAAAPPPAQPLTIINNYYYTPMSGANGLFGR